MSENSIGVAFLNFTCEESIITSPIAIILILKIMHLHCKTDNLKCLKKLLKKQLLIQRPATPLPPHSPFCMCPGSQYAYRATYKQWKGRHTEGEVQERFNGGRMSHVCIFPSHSLPQILHSLMERRCRKQKGAMRINIFPIME